MRTFSPTGARIWAAKRISTTAVGVHYDCITIMSYYTVCKAVTSFREIEEMEENLILRSSAGCGLWTATSRSGEADVQSICAGERRLRQMADYEMTVAYDKDKLFIMNFTSLSAAEFAIQHGLTDIMPALCNVDYASMELLQRKTGADDHLRGRLPMRLYQLRRQKTILKGTSRIPGRGGFRRNK